MSLCSLAWLADFYCRVEEEGVVLGGVFSGGSRLVSGFSGGLFDAPGYFFGVRLTFSDTGPGKYQGVCGVNAQNGGVSPVC